jgi:hypothetical protein
VDLWALGARIGAHGAPPASVSEIPSATRLDVEWARGKRIVVLGFGMNADIALTRHYIRKVLHRRAAFFGRQPPDMVIRIGADRRRQYSRAPLTAATTASRSRSDAGVARLPPRHRAAHWPGDRDRHRVGCNGFARPDREAANAALASAAFKARCSAFGVARVFVRLPQSRLSIAFPIDLTAVA